MSNPLEPPDEILAFRLSLDQETDRGCALMAAAYIDHELMTLLERVFCDDKRIRDELLGPSRPLASFSSRIDLAYALGLLSTQTWRDLHLVREVRNDFGHERGLLRFEDPAIKSRCGELRTDPFHEQLPPRKKFVRAAMMLLEFILHEQELAQHAVPKKTIELGISEAMKKPIKSPRPRKGKRKP